MSYFMLAVYLAGWFVLMFLNYRQAQRIKELERALDDSLRPIRQANDLGESGHVTITAERIEAWEKVLHP